RVAIPAGAPSGAPVRAVVTGPTVAVTGVLGEAYPITAGLTAAHQPPTTEIPVVSPLPTSAPLAAAFSPRFVAPAIDDRHVAGPAAGIGDRRASVRGHGHGCFVRDRAARNVLAQIPATPRRNHIAGVAATIDVAD